MKQVFPWPQVGSITLTFPAQAGRVAVNKWSVWPIAYTMISRTSNKKRLLRHLYRPRQRMHDVVG